MTENEQTKKPYVYSNATIEPPSMELHTRSPQPIPIEPETEYISISDMRQLTTATIKFRGVLVHADCRSHNGIVVALVHLKQNGKMYATVVNDDDALDMFITRHKLTMWLHKAINTIDLNEVKVND